MASKGRGVLKVIGTLKVLIPAGTASPSPPLGPALGQVFIAPSTYSFSI